MKHLLIVSLFLFSLPLVAQGQPVRTRFIGAGLVLGAGHTDMSRLNVFMPSEMRKLEHEQSVFGVTGYSFVNRYVIGLTGVGLLGDRIMNDTIVVSTGGGIGTIGFGYLLVNREMVKVFPLIGIGGSHFGVRMAKNNTVWADDLVKNPGREIKIGIDQWAIDISMNLNIIASPLFDNEEGGYGTPMMGVKIGYILSLPSSHWNFSNGNVLGGPYFGINMVYVQLMSCAIGYRKKSE